jgi:hypothetical protein
MSTELAASCSSAAVASLSISSQPGSRKGAFIPAFSLQ